LSNSLICKDEPQTILH